MLNTWQLIKELVKGSGFYKKQFFFFAGLFFIFGTAFLVINQYKFSADQYVPPEGNLEETPYLNLELHVQKDGKIVCDGKTVGYLEFDKKYAILRYIVLNSPDTAIDQARVKVKFDFILPRDFEYRVIATHHLWGVVQSHKVDNHSVAFTGYDLGPDTIFTAYARFPKSYIAPPLWRQVLINLSTLPVKLWLIIGAIFPILAFIFICYMLAKSRLFSKKSGKQIIEPPTDLPPALVGVLLTGKIGPREISATLIDLAKRNYLHIFTDGEDFSFGRGKALESEKIYQLHPYEKLLLSKIFPDDNVKSSLEDINVHLGKQLFSRKMAQVFLEIYNEISQHGYFAENPGLVHQKYRTFGLGLFFIGIIGFALNSVINSDFLYLLFLWFGTILASIVIITLASRMPTLTEKGIQARKEWLGFRSYLKSNQKTTITEEMDNPYTQYLAYAIVLNVEVAWTKRFLKSLFSRPSWFDSGPQISTIEDFANAVFPLIGYISHNLIISRTPVIE